MLLVRGRLHFPSYRGRGDHAPLLSSQQVSRSVCAFGRLCGVLDLPPVAKALFASNKQPIFG